MFKGIEVYKINTNINLYTYKAEQFKTDTVGVFFERPLEQAEASRNALLAAVMRRGTGNYPKSREMYQALEELYGAVLSTDVNKFGERQILKFQMQFADAKYIDEKDIFSNSMRMLNEVVNNPYIENVGFSKDYFMQERENLIVRINNQINNKMAYAFDRCIEEMFKGEPFAVNNDGDKDVLLSLDEKDLYEHYKAVQSTSNVDIFIISKEEKKQYAEDILKSFEFKNLSPVAIGRERHTYPHREPREITEKMDIAQGKLVMGFRTNVPYEDRLYRPLLVFNEILGGGSYSKLFSNIREKESLCYSIFSTIEKFKSALFIAGGIDFDQKDRAVALINEEVEKMKRGLFEEEELENAKKSIISSIDGINDSPNKIMNYYYSRILSASYMEAEEIKRRFMAVDKDSVVEAAQNIFLDTIYFLDKKGGSIEKN